MISYPLNWSREAGKGESPNLKLSFPCWHSEEGFFILVTYVIRYECQVILNYRRHIGRRLEV